MIDLFSVAVVARATRYSFRSSLAIKKSLGIIVDPRILFAHFHRVMFDASLMIQ